MSEWADRVGTDISGQLQSEFRQLLLEQLGLDVKLKSPPCNRSDDMYSPAVNGWNNGMSSSILKYYLTRYGIHVLIHRTPCSQSTL